MNQEKIGKFLAKIRTEKKMTQKELAKKLNVTDRAISNWENGRRLPDYSIVKDLCHELNISINEFFAGERLTDENYKSVADENLMNALESSVFTLKEKIDYFKKKWEKDHIFELMIWMSIIVGFIIFGFIRDNGLQYLFMIIGFISGIIENNRMMAYIEKHAYGKESNISVEEFHNSIKKLKEMKEIIQRFPTKREAIEYLCRETNISKNECLEVYDFIIKLDLDKIDF